MPSEIEFIHELIGEGCCSSVTIKGDEFFISAEDDEKVRNFFDQHGMSFAIRHSGDREDGSARRLLWAYKDVDFFGTPFCVTKWTALECVNGPKPKEKSDQQVVQMKQRYRLSKKMDCPAKMKITKVILYPDFSVSGIEKNLCRIKRMKMKELHRLLKTTTHLQTETHFFITVSKPSLHSHSVWTPFSMDNQEDNGVIYMEVGEPENASPEETTSPPNSPPQSPPTAQKLSLQRELAHNFSQILVSQLKEKAENVLDLTNLIPPDIDATQLKKILLNVGKAEALLKQSIERGTVIASTPSKKRKV